MRALILIHRYLGIAIGLIMAMWCASGIVMMYVSFPSLDNDQRLRNLEPIAWQDCCQSQKIADAINIDVADSFSIEMVAQRPVLTVAMVVGNRHTFDLRTGEHIAGFDRDQVLAVAKRGSSEDAQYLGLIASDQWTIQDQFNRYRPLHHIALNDTQGTELYVSDINGQVVQQTTRSVRFWNWLGSVPHWLYPTVLRQHPALWSQVVVWLSIAGAFLTMLGLYIGITHWRAMKGARWSPYRGVPLWHHLSGLFFGVLTLTWVASGLVSMSPWGLFEGTGFKEQRDEVRGVWIDSSQLAHTLTTLASTPALKEAVRVEAAPLNGKLYLLIYRSAADAITKDRIDVTSLQSAPLQLADIQRAAINLAGREAQVDFLNEGDDYYYSGHEPRTFPVYRVAATDAEHTRYYLDADSGDLLVKIGTNERWFRWAFEGLHRLDFSKTLRIRPWWDLFVLPLILGVTLVCFTGVAMGYRRVMPRKSSVDK